MVVGLYWDLSPTGQRLSFSSRGPASRTGLTHIRVSDIFYHNEETACKRKIKMGQMLLIIKQNRNLLFCRKCALTGQSKSCKHRIKLGDSSNYYYISPFCRYRVSDMTMMFNNVLFAVKLTSYDISPFWPRSLLYVTFLHTSDIFSRDL